MNWLEISLTLDGELAEAVADVLSRHAHQGVSIESTSIESGPDDEGRPVGPVRVRAYFPADDPPALEALRTRLEQDLFYLGMIQPVPDPTFTIVPETDWAELWKAHYHPIRTGEHLVVVPEWLYESYARHELRPADVPLLMDPGMAFGTGTHPTTQLCLALLERYVQPGGSVLDLGCGSGILSVAAIKLGAAQALGLDIDPVAIPVARDNARRNRVLDKIEFRLGSLEHRPAQPVDITVVNILAGVILRLMNEGLAGTVSPKGVLILSGILAAQAGQVTSALEGASLSVVEARQSGDWIALAARRISS
jgi:ribosomal protein L11 methyltransferase